MMSTTRPLFVVIAIGIAIAIQSASAAEPTLVEHVTKRIKDPGVGLATKLYEPSEEELPFFKMLAPEEITTGGLAGPYDITKKSGKFVGWFGIIREVEEDATGKRTVLTVEHKYFDGFTDAHILALSFNGSGDFQAVLNGPGHEIPLLALVKAYGTVAPAAKGKLPRVNAQFLRVWHWETFTFLDVWGEQQGSEKWRKLNQVDLDDIYETHPQRTYYEQRLGAPRASKAARAHLMRIAGRMTPDLETRVSTVIDAVYRFQYRELFSSSNPMLDVREDDAAIAVLAECLQNPDESIRLMAAMGLGAVGPKAIPWLISALQSKKPGVRASAAFALSNHGSDAKEAVPTLIAALADEESEVRTMSALALGTMGLAARSAAPPLKQLLDDSDPNVRMKAAYALWFVTTKPQPSVDVLSKLLTDEDQNIRYEAADKLAEFGPDAKDAIPALVAALTGDDRFVRSQAARVLGGIGPAAKVAVPALVAALSDEYSFARAGAAEALGEIRADAETVVPALINVLSDPDDFTRSRAVDALAEYGPAAAKAIPVLVKMLKEEPQEIWRGSCGRELVKIDPTGKTFVPVLIENLRDPSTSIRRFAAWALGDLGPAAAVAVEPLTGALKDPELVVQVYAAGALWKIDEQNAGAAIPVLTAALSSDDQFIRRWAADEILGTAPEAIRAVPALIECLTKDPSAVAAADALGRIGPRATAAVDPLTKLLRDEKGEIRTWVAEALYRIHCDDKYLQLLIEALDSEYLMTRESAAISLGRIGPKAKDAVPGLNKLREHPEMYIRQIAAEALKKINSAADGE